MRIINLTPHAINFLTPKGEVIIIPPSGTVARLSVRTETIGEINGIPVTTSVFGEVEGLPAPATDTIFVVSSLVAGRVPERSGKDVFIPNESVRDENGRIVGCKSLGVI